MDSDDELALTIRDERPYGLPDVAAILDAETPAGRRYVLGVLVHNVALCAGAGRCPREAIAEASNALVIHHDDINENGSGFRLTL